MSKTEGFILVGVFIGCLLGLIPKFEVKTSPILAGIIFFVAWQSLILFMMWEHYHYHDRLFDWKLNFVMEAIPAAIMTFTVAMIRYLIYVEKNTEKEKNNANQ